MENSAYGEVLAVAWLDKISQRHRPREIVPFLSSIVTVSFAHFIRNLAGGQRCLRETSLEVGAQLEDLSLQKSRMRGLPDKLHLDFVEFRYYCERPRV